MALGDLSPDQARYAAKVASLTGLDPSVVVAWIGSESGWATTKSSHNYLNIGPGRQYQSVDQAAAAAAGLLNSSSYYGGIRNAIAISPAAQVDAIEASPWDVGHYGGSQHRLLTLWQALTGKGGSINLGDPNGPTATNVGLIDPIAGIGNVVLPGIGDLTRGLVGATGLTKIVNTAIAAVSSSLLTLVFTAAALGLVGLGLARLTGNNARDLFGKLQGTTEQVAQVAKIAAVA